MCCRMLHAWTLQGAARSADTCMRMHTQACVYSLLRTMRIRTRVSMRIQGLNSHTIACRVTQGRSPNAMQAPSTNQLLLDATICSVEILPLKSLPTKTRVLHLRCHRVLSNALHHPFTSESPPPSHLSHLGHISKHAHLCILSGV